jgi:hypothetical protein
VETKLALPSALVDEVWALLLVCKLLGLAALTVFVS